MDCPICKIQMEKDYFNANSKDKLSFVTLWKYEKCGYRDRSQHDVSK